ncbi:hypothetical protein ACTMTI_55410, partial [Nonomuraea sp. H19]
GDRRHSPELLPTARSLSRMVPYGPTLTVAQVSGPEWFDTDTGLPESMLKAKNARTWLEFARAYMNVRWPHLAAKSRQNSVESLVAVTLALTTHRKGRPDTTLLRRALHKHVFLRKRPPARGRPAGRCGAALAGGGLATGD